MKKQKENIWKDREYLHLVLATTFFLTWSIQFYFLLYFLFNNNEYSLILFIILGFVLFVIGMLAGSKLLNLDKLK